MGKVLKRYIFHLCSFKLSDGASLRALRRCLSSNPEAFHLAGDNVSWHLAPGKPRRCS